MATITIRGLDQELKDRIDAAASFQHRKRIGFVVHAVTEAVKAAEQKMEEEQLDDEAIPREFSRHD